MQIQAAWRMEAEKRLQAKGVSVSKFPSKRFRGEFFRTIGHTYWNRLIKFTQLQKLDDIQIADRLGLVGSTTHRWVSGENPAGADKFFAVVLLVLKNELEELHLGTRDQLLFDAVSLQLERLAIEYDGIPSCKLDRFMLKSVSNAMELPDVVDLVPCTQLSTIARRNSLEKVVKGLNDYIKRDFHRKVERKMTYAGRPMKINPSQLDEWLASWGIAYTLFAMGCEKVTTWGIENVAD